MTITYRVPLKAYVTKQSKDIKSGDLITITEFNNNKKHARLIKNKENVMAICIEDMDENRMIKYENVYPNEAYSIPNRCIFPMETRDTIESDYPN